MVSVVRLGASRESVGLTFSRETSNKALTAVNALQLVPFLMSFLSSRAKLPVSVVTAAGPSRRVASLHMCDGPVQRNVFSFCPTTTSRAQKSCAQIRPTLHVS